DRLNWSACAATARAEVAAYIQDAGRMVRCTDGRAISALSHGLAAVANLGAANLLVCVRYRHLLRLQYLQLQTWPAQNPRRNRLVTGTENRGSDLDCFRLARLDPVAGTVSDGLHPRPTRYCHRCGWVRARVESGRSTKLGCPSFRS